MRILHVGWGYSPLFSGGVTVYVEDLMRALAERGHEQHYFCCGRSDFRLRPHLQTWVREGVGIYEVRNPPARVTPFVGTRQPELDIDHQGLRRIFRRILEDVRPYVVHVQMLLGLPARLIDDVKDAGIRLVVTLEDFHSLCPTQLLYREARQENCTDYGDGWGCLECCRHSPSEAGWMRVKSAAWHGARPLRNHCPRLYQALRPAARGLFASWRRSRLASRTSAHSHAQEQAAAFRFRRAEFVRLLGQADVVHALSSALFDLHLQCGVPADRLVRIGTTVGLIGSVRPTARSPSRPLVFGFRGGFSRGKGAQVLLEAIRDLPPTDAVLRIDGEVEAAVRGAVAEAEARGQVRYYGRYRREKLQQILEATDVGVVPSVWREGYPLVCLEFLAARIPVIATRIGGIPDSVSDGQNGFLVPPGDPVELREAMRRFIRNPDLILRLRQQIGPVKSMEQHVAEVEALYRGGLAAENPPSAVCDSATLNADALLARN